MKGLLVIGALLFAVPASYADEHAYVGSNKCRKCHLKEYKSWAATKMATSFDLLKPGERAEQKKAADLDPDKDYTADAECLPCHTTGYGESSGFVDIKNTPDLAGVGCENCHGAAETYIQDQYMSLKNKEYEKEEVVAVGMVDQITTEKCTMCHNNKSPFVDEDFVFDFETKKDQGTHEQFPLKYAH